MRTQNALLIALVATSACKLDNSFSFETQPIERDPVVQWFNAKGYPIANTSPSSDDTELINLVAMLTANGRLIGAGEATHGTRQFFELKDKILRSLITRRASISAFAIEASMPDAVAIDDYVRQGIGDPVKALSHLYFWTWRTQEVLDLIRWLHDYNASLPAAQRVGFYGVDFQYPGGAIRRILNWVPPAFSTLRAQVSDDYACVSPYVNDELGQFSRILDSASTATRTQCRTGAQAALDAIRAQAGALRAAVGEESYALHERLAMSVVQFATRAAGGVSAAFRDSVMAQNAMWLFRRNSGRVFLWAHNYHISKNGLSMGRWLNDSLGTQYQAIGFMFDSGSFNARPDTAAAPPTALRIGQARDSSYEAFFRQFKSTIYFDSHGATDITVRRFLIGPKPMHEIGALFYPDAPDFFIRRVSLFNEFDDVIFVPESAPTRLLPFTP